MIINAFIDQAKQSPTALAIEHSGVHVDYATLLGRVNAFARHLHTLGIGPDTRVAFVLPKSIDAVIVLLGALMTGAAYVPLDARQPPERICRSLVDCDARALVTTAPLLERLLAVEPALEREIAALITPGPCHLANARQHDFSSTAAALSDQSQNSIHSPAYILYTSGSTGEPKGVVHTMESASRFVQWAVRAFQIDATQVLANFAQFSFDLSILDLFGALTSGASVHLVPPEMLFRPKELVNKLSDWSTTLLYAVPSAISLMESDGELANRAPAGLRRLLYAGEPFPVPQLIRVMNALPNTTVYNLYGPTETNVCTYHELGRVPSEGTSQIPIGKACEHLTVDILDENGKPVKCGDEGELCVTGSSVMTGYFRKASATEQAFFPKTNFADGRERYRTGDRARRDEIGLIWFLGRRDRMVKKRGYRIELGEIESVLNDNPSVREAVVIAVNTDEGTRVIAAVALQNGCAASVLTLKAQCGRLLPPYMVPDSILVMDELPRTPNGKVDLMRLRDMSTV